MHGCFSISVLHIQQNVFELVNYQDVKGLEAFQEHREVSWMLNADRLVHLY